MAAHRNGVSGNLFHAVRFNDPQYGNFLATVFEEPGNVAVINLDLLPEHGVAFGENSWRGDNYETFLRNGIANYKEQKTLSFVIKKDGEPTDERLY